MLDWIKGLEASFSVVAMFLGAAAFMTSWLTRGSKTNAIKIDRLESENTALHGRVSDLEAVLDTHPNREDIHALTLKLSEMDGKIGAVSTKLGAVERIATRIDDFLLSTRGE